ncbi:MAG: hypothetical protein F6K54_01150 [Okeania sp. SIO3B5]|uniref:hypothetical protein n=1 Tax=Okeania sp. SIO3B5 TaxID=2607811 RepID=UPI0013FF2A10|nr:hypothetical protein [Okeania sp. SIO3B5]NEO51814.1 hypothetical protein [Okeania sp. SIO3B5]
MNDERYLSDRFVQNLLTNVNLIKYRIVRFKEGYILSNYSNISSYTRLDTCSILAVELNDFR